MARTKRTETAQVCIRTFSMTLWYFNLPGKECLFNQCYLHNWLSIWKKPNKQKDSVRHTKEKKIPDTVD